MTNTLKNRLAFVASLAGMALLVKPLSTATQPIQTCKAVSVIDGDTFYCNGKDGSVQAVRVFGVDAPERTQAYGIKASQTLKRLLAGQVQIVVVGHDRYARTLACVQTPHVPDVSLALVQEGAAWWMASYAPKESELQAAEEQARQAKRGLWADPKPIAPWLYRRGAQTP